MIKIHEDWVVVIIGFLFIGLALFNIQSPVAIFSWSGISDFSSKILTRENISKIGVQFLFVSFGSVLAAVFTGKPLKNYFFSFIAIYLLSLIALVLAGNKEVKLLNLEAVIFSLSIGLVIGNVFTLPQWFRDSLTSELFVKIGLIILGTTVIFGDILKAGSFGLLQAIIVVLTVWYFAFWLCKKFKVDQEMSMMISSAVSICGVSAAIATAGAIKGDTKKLSYVISLVLIVAIPMMIGMPYLAAWMGLSQAVTGAWLGGSIDTTGAVVASGTLVGEEALKISTIVKFSQNVLLGIAAFAISVYWTIGNKKNTGVAKEETGLKVIWQRFPKFVIGFIVVSLLFSFFVSAERVAEVKDSLKNLQNLLFVLAFTSIGLETRFSDLIAQQNRRPLIVFLIAQFFNILVTLLVAYLLFR